MSDDVDIVVGEDGEGMRADRFLASALPELSRTRVAAALTDGSLRVDGAPVAPSRRLRAGERVHGVLPTDRRSRLEAEAIPLVVLHEDEDVIVVDKPPGMVVHPGAGVSSGTLAQALLHHVGESLRQVGGADRPGIVHRLDKGTSGVIVAAKSGGAHLSLTRQFAARSVEKRYTALVLGLVDAAGEAVTPIGRSRTDRTKMAVDGAAARPAVTSWSPLEAFGRVASLLDVALHTGRTHQVRVHLASVGHPLVGDEAHGGLRARGIADGAARRMLLAWKRPALHARRLAFEHPRTGARLAFEAPLPADLQKLLARLRSHFAPRGSR